MITLNRIEQRTMVFAVADCGVVGEFGVSMSDHIDADDAAAVAEHVEAARVGLVYELVHPLGRGEGRFAAIPRAKRARPIDAAAEEYIACADDRKLEPKERAKRKAARAAAREAAK